MFYRELYILPQLLVFASGLPTVSCRKTWKCSRKSLVKSLMKTFVGFSRNYSPNSSRVRTIIDVFSTALHSRYAAFLLRVDFKLCLVDKRENFPKKLEENNKIALGTAISIRVHRWHCVYTLNWPFEAWASWRRGQSLYQFPAERRSSRGLIWHRRRSQKISTFPAL